MKWSCCVPCCTNNFRNVDSTISSHRIPKNINVRKKWLMKIRRDLGKNFQISYNTRICSAHFVETDFQRNPRKIKLLRDNAVPSIFSWNKLQELTKQARSEQRLERIKKREQSSRKRAPTEQVAENCIESDTANIINLDEQPLEDHLQETDAIDEVEPKMDARRIEVHDGVESLITPAGEKPHMTPPKRLQLRDVVDIVDSYSSEDSNSCDELCQSQSDDSLHIVDTEYDTKCSTCELLMTENRDLVLENSSLRCSVQELKEEIKRLRKV